MHTRQRRLGPLGLVLVASALLGGCGGNGGAAGLDASDAAPSGPGLIQPDAAGRVPGDGGAAGGDLDATARTEDGAVKESDAGATQRSREACKLVTAQEGDGPAGKLTPRVEVVAQGLEVPWGLAFLPNGDMLVTERPGRLRRIRGGQLLSTPVLEVNVAKVSFLEELGMLGSEGGLLGVALLPDFASSRLFYLYYTARDAAARLVNRLALYKLADDGNSASLQRVILDDIPGGVHHQGGRLQIGPDQKLYVAVGAYDPGLAQRPDQLAGKLLRLNLDGSMPSDNPTAGSYVFLTGVRNSQGFDWFDAQHLLVMDHGPTAIDPGVPETGWDELTVARAGENLGWPDVLGCETASGISEPVLVWERSMPPGGAAIYKGSAIPDWTGSFMVATLGLPQTGEGDHLHRIQVRADNPYIVEKHEVYLKGEYGRLRTVAMGPDGHLYITTSNCDPRGLANGRCANGGDKILRIVGAN